MGFDPATIQFLAASRKLGVSLDRVLTLGRQWMYIKPGHLQALLARNGVHLSPAEAVALFADDGYCERFLKSLGAADVDSMDVSAYEKATIIHDLNQPWPDSLQERFSLIIDAGTLEHVFNFPVAIRSIMEAIAPGGHFLCITPANNLMGHGFYQFSPELFFRVFTPENGFAIEKVIVYEQPWKDTWYEVANPSVVRSRVELVNTRPVYMIVCAKKIASVDVLAQAPVQSDYPLMYWLAAPGAEAAGVNHRPGAPALRRLAPDWVASWYRKLRPFRPRYFKKVRS